MMQRRHGAGLVVDRHDRVVTLRIDREERLGALSTALLAALEAEVSVVADDASIGALVLTGTGRSFVAGADLAEYRELDDAGFADYQARSRRLFDRIASLPQPVIAAVNGFALGGGFELALACDMIIAARCAVFGLPEVGIGLVPGGGGPQRLARRTSPTWAKEIAMTGRRITADEALMRGVAARVVDDDALMVEAGGLAAELAARPWRSVRALKRLIDDGIERTLDEALAADQLALLELHASPDGREGVAAFVEKRPARFEAPGGGAAERIAP